MIIRWLFLVVIVLSGVAPLAAEVSGDLYSKTPLAFEPNKGQADSTVRFLSRGNGYGLYLTDTEAVLTLMGATPVAVRMKMAGQRPTPKIEGMDLQPGVSNYLLGGDRKDWKGSVPHFSKVKYRGVYPGIDVIYYGSQRQLEYDFAIAPAANPNTIQIDFSGVDRLSISGEGDLVLHTAAGELRHKRPVAYQDWGGERKPVPAEFVLRGDRQVGFKLGAYNRNLALTIDPTLAWSSYLGGNGDDAGLDLTLDAAGNVYVTGYTLSTDFWVIGAPQPTLTGRMDAFVTKINPSAAIMYSSYLGGSGDDESHSIGLDAAGNIYITGLTTSTDFPVINGFQPKFGGVMDAYVLKLNNSGSAIQYSTYVGGSQSDRALGIAVDPGGNMFVTGTTSSQNFPILNAFKSTYGGGLGDAFVMKIASTGALAQSTFLGGIGNDQAYDIVLDGDGNVVVTGFTSSVNFPTAKALYSQFRGGDYDAFITKFDATGNTLNFSTYMGGSSTDIGVRLAVDANKNIYITGQTASFDFPLKNPAQFLINQDLTVTAFDAFLMKLNPDGQDASFSTFIGSEDTESGVSVAVGPDGSVYLAGYTNSLGFYAINSVGGFLRGARDGFVMKISSDAAEVVFSTYLGGFGIDGATALAIDAAGNAYVTGFTTSSDFPLAPDAFQAGIFGGQDGFIVKINTDDIKTISPFQISNQGGASIATAGQTSVPIFGYATGDLSSGFTPTGLEIVDLRSVGVLVNEVSIPLAPHVLVGRLLAKTAATDGTAVSMVNPSGADIRVDYYFTSEGGETGNEGFFTLPAFAHVSALLTSEPFNIPPDKSGTLTFSAADKVAVAALRVDTSAANPVNSYIPVVDLYAANNLPVTVPQFADGLGYSTQFVLINTTEAVMEGELRLYKNGEAGGPGVPAELATEQGIKSVFPYSIASRGAQIIITRGETGEIVTGHADIVPTEGFYTPAVFANLILSENAGFLKTTVEAQEAKTEFKMYVESSGTFGEPLAATPALALANASDTPAVVTLELTNLEGVPSGLTGSITIQPKAHLSAFLRSIPGFENLASPFKGVLRVTTSDPGVTFAGFRTRYNERNQFLAMATGPLKDLGDLNRVIFPQLVDGGGYATQFVLINGTSGGGSVGIIRYLNQSGEPLNVAVEK